MISAPRLLDALASQVKSRQATCRQGTTEGMARCPRGEAITRRGQGAAVDLGPAARGQRTAGVSRRELEHVAEVDLAIGRMDVAIARAARRPVGQHRSAASRDVEIDARGLRGTRAVVDLAVASARGRVARRARRGPGPTGAGRRAAPAEARRKDAIFAGRAGPVVDTGRVGRRRGARIRVALARDEPEREERASGHHRQRRGAAAHRRARVRRSTRAATASARPPKHVGILSSTPPSAQEHPEEPDVAPPPV
jgi:hypothetical protein